MANKDCLSCKFCKWSRDDEDWECTNEASDNYALEVEFCCPCERLEERE